MMNLKPRRILKSTRFTALRWIGLAACCAFALMLPGDGRTARVAHAGILDAPARSSLKEVPVMGVGKDKIALIQIEGVIHDQGTMFSPRNLLAETIEELKTAERDEEVKAVLLFINSPGGSVTASDILHHRILKFKESGKKVVVLMGDLAASGGYYISAPADRILAHPTTITGSIGVIIQAMNLQGLYGKIGLETVTIKSGDKKDMLSSSRNLTAEERKMLQEIVQEMHGRFVEIVMNGRKLKKAEVEKIADGRILTARSALNHKLIDQIGYLEDAVEATKELAKLKHARVVRYQRTRSLFDLFGGVFSQSTVNIGMNVNLGANLSFVPPRFMYLWSLGSFAAR